MGRPTATNQIHYYPFRSPNFKQRADKVYWRPWSLFPFMNTQMPLIDVLKCVRRKRMMVERPAECYRWDGRHNAWLPNHHEQDKYNQMPFTGVGHLYDELA